MRLRPHLLLAAICVLAVAAGALLPARVTEAHALLAQSDPPVNARLQDPPTQVTGVFTESLDQRLSYIQVLSGTGDRVDADKTTFGPEDTRMSAAITGTLEPGFYTVVWQTLSAVDGHLFKGSYPFTVLNSDGSEPSGPRFVADVGSYGGARPGWVITKWTNLLAAMTLVGSLAFVAWVVRPASNELEPEPERKRRVRTASRRHLAWLGWPAAIVLAVTAVSELLLKAHDVGGLSSISDVLQTSWGHHWVQRQIVLGIIAVALFLVGRLWRGGRDRLSESAVWVALSGGFAYLLLVAMVSHGGGVPGSFWAVAADFLHLAASSVWIGMLAQLALLLWWAYKRLDPEEQSAVVAAHLQRFSVLAATSVVLLLATGAVNGLAQIPDLSAMLDTAYGRALTIKLSIMAALLIVAAANAFLLRPQTIKEGSGSERSSRRLTTMVRIEIILAVAVVLMAAVLIQYPTSRVVRNAESATDQQPQAVVGYEEIVETADLKADLSISPNSVGTNSFRLFLFPAQGGTIGEVTRVRLRFKPPDPAIGPSEIIADPLGAEFPNQFKAVGAFFTQPGGWEVQADIRRRDVDDVSAIFRPKVTGANLVTGSKYDYPLVVGSWAAVAAIAALLGALLMAVWATQWPDLPLRAPRLLRVGSASVTVVGAGMLVISLLPGGGSATGNPVEATAESIAMGRSLYTANCSACHGPDGHGDGPQAPSLEVRPADFRQHVPYHSDEFFFAVITNGLGTFMPSWASTLSEHERWDIINFLKSEFGINAQTTSR